MRGKRRPETDAAFRSPSVDRATPAEPDVERYIADPVGDAQDHVEETEVLLAGLGPQQQQRGKGDDDVGGPDSEPGGNGFFLGELLAAVDEHVVDGDHADGHQVPRCLGAAGRRDAERKGDERHHQAGHGDGELLVHLDDVLRRGLAGDHPLADLCAQLAKIHGALILGDRPDVASSLAVE